jgi:adenylate cyclase
LAPDPAGPDDAADLSDEPTAVVDAVGDLLPEVERLDPEAASQAIEAFLLGAEPSLTRVEVAARAGVPLELAQRLWHWLGFPHAADDDVAFAESDVEALRLASDLLRMGILRDESLAALVRTWGRSYARLAEWQTTLLADFALEGTDLDLRITELAAGVLPRVEALQSYVWRRHLSNAAARLLTTTGTVDTTAMPLAVCFVDIVGYTSQSKNLTEGELVEMVELFEQGATDAVVQGGGRVIKMIGDEILFAADDVAAATAIALELTRRGADEDDAFPAVRAGLAHGPVVARLGDVFGATVNIAARLTSVARPGTVVIDGGAHDVLSPSDEPGTTDDGGADAAPDDTPGDTPGDATGSDDRGTDDDAPGDTESGEEALPADSPAGAGAEDEPAGTEGDAEVPAYRFKRLRRVSVKGYSRLEAWAVRPPKGD